MNGEEKALADALRHQASICRRAQKQVAAAREALLEAGTCSNSEEHLGSYHWEHDNGYGRQTKHVGKRCCLCEAIVLWDRGRFVRPERINQW